MGTKITFYTNPRSRGRIIRWMLEETGQPYQTRVMEYGTTMKSPEYLAINPMGKVPAIRHGDIIVTEVAAICAYLADAYPDAKLAPQSGNPLRGPFYRWLFFASGPLESAVSNKALGFEVPREREPMIGYGSYDKVMDVVEDALEGKEYLVGERFSAADLCLGSQLGFGMQFGTVEKCPAFEAYWDRISNRPAAVKARELDDALIPPEQT